MLIVFSSRFQAVISFSILLLGVFVTPLARADATDACFNFYNAQDFSRAEESAKSLLQNNGLNHSEQRNANYCLGLAYRNLGRTQDALVAFQKMEALSETPEELAPAYNLLCVTYIDTKDYERAELYGQRTLKYYRGLTPPDKNGISTALNNLALIEDNRGNKDHALALFKESLSMKSGKDKVATLNNIASMYAAQKDYPKAVKMMRQALEISRRNGDSQAIASLQLNLGATLVDQGDLVAAEKELTAGYKAIRLLGDKNQEAGACFNFAQIAAARKQNPVARDWYGKAEVIFREIGNEKYANAMRRMADKL